MSARHLEEVATMEIYTKTRPSTPLTAACAPFAVRSAAAAPVAAPVMAARRAPISQAHQVQAQAELAGTGVYGINGTTGFKGLGSSIVGKLSVDERGVPPRGRPV
jgi:hypothetical protein